jgi:hypothetical protein
MREMDCDWKTYIVNMCEIKKDIKKMDCDWKIQSFSASFPIVFRSIYSKLYRIVNNINIV